MNKKTPYLSVVIPCYNEASNLEKKVLEKVEAFLLTKKYSWEVLLVDDGSLDDSRELIKKFIKERQNWFLIANKHQGKAMAVTSGVVKARGQYILFADLDQATPISEMDKLMPFFQKGYQVVIGSRAGVRRGAPTSRLIMARGFMLLRSLILGLSKISDTQCGFKMLERSAVLKLFPKLRLYHKPDQVSGSRVTAGFDVELLFLAKKLGFKTKEVAVQWDYVETRRVNPLRDSWDGLVDLLRIRQNDFLGKYDE